MPIAHLCKHSGLRILPADAGWIRRKVEHLVVRRKTPHDILFVIIVLPAARRLVFIVDGACEYETASRTKDQRRAAQDRRRRSLSHIVTEAKLGGNGYDTGLDASRLR